MALFPTGKLLAGNWPEGFWIGVLKQELSFYDRAGGGGYFQGEKVALAEIESVELATEETVQKFSSTVGAGLVGLALLGPVGLLAGVLIGRKKEMTFILRLRDGRQALITGEQRCYVQIQAAMMTNKIAAPALAVE